MQTLVDSSVASVTKWREKEASGRHDVSNVLDTRVEASRKVAPNKAWVAVASKPKRVRTLQFGISVVPRRKGAPASKSG